MQRSRARQGYACFDAFGEDVQRYGYAASLNIERSCEDEVVEQLVDLRRRAAEYAKRDGRIAADEYFVAEQNARVVRDAETYYRAMFRGGAESWNVRDRPHDDDAGGICSIMRAVPIELRAPSSGRTTHTSAMRAPRAWPTSVN